MLKAQDCGSEDLGIFPFSLPQTCCVTFGKSLSRSVPLSPCGKVGENSLMGAFEAYLHGTFPARTSKPFTTSHERAEYALSMACALGLESELPLWQTAAALNYLVTVLKVSFVMVVRSSERSMGKGSAGAEFPFHSSGPRESLFRDH